MIKKIEKEKIIDIAILLFILAVTLWNICDMSRIKVIDDEFGYWGIAAVVTGYDWSDLMAATWYYSFGYSLLLIPLFWLNRLGLAMSTLYQIAIVMNAVMLCGVYFLVKYSVKRLFEDISPLFTVAISFFVVVYIGNTAQSGSAWTETYCLFMFWCIVALIIRMLEQASYSTLFWLCIAAVNILAIHMRTVGILIAVIVVLGVLFIFSRKQTNWKYIVFCGVLLAVLLGIFIIIKNYVTYGIYASDGSSVNDISSNVTKTKALLSVSGMVDLLMSVLGKLYSVSASSFLMTMLGCVMSLGHMIRSLYGQLCKKQNSWQNREWVCLFVNLAFWGEVMVSAIFKSFGYYSQNVTSTLADTIVYSRYLDFVTGPMMIIGCMGIYKITCYYKEVIISLFVFLLSAIAVQHQYDILSFYNGEETLGFRGTAVPWIANLYEGNLEYFAYYTAGISLIVFGGMCAALLCIKKKEYTLIILLFTVGVWWGMKGASNTDEFLESKINKEKKVATVEEIIQTTDNDTPIYLVAGDGKSAFTDVKILQWCLGKRGIKVCAYDELNDQILKEAVLLADSADNRINAMLSDVADYIYDSGTIAVFASEDNNYYTELKECATQMFRRADPTVNKVNLLDVTTELSYIKANGSMYYTYQADEGYLTEGMNLSLEDGIYEFTVDMRIRDCETGSQVGYITIGDTEGNIQDTIILEADSFISKSRQQIKVQVKVQDKKDPVIGIYSYGSAAFRIYGITYQKIAGNILIDEKKMPECITGKENSKICYVDSDNSALTGFPDIVKDMYYLPGGIIEYKEIFQDDYYIVEKTNPTVIQYFVKRMNCIDENENFVVFGRKQ